MESLLVLATFAVCDVMKGRGQILHPIACCEVDAHHHRHLHPIPQVVSEVVLYGLLHLNCHHSPLLLVLH